MKKGYKWLLILLFCWISIEIWYQFYLRSKWVKNSYYNWEDYAFSRNKLRIVQIDNFFSNFKRSYFNYSVNPNDGNLSQLPENIVHIINDLEADLSSEQNNFELNFQRMDSNNYVIYLSSGATFRTSFNGYNFEVVITNAGEEYHDGYSPTDTKNIFIEKDLNKEYRENPFILRYSMNNYDLLILKLFRP